VAVSDDRRTVAVPLGTVHTGAPQDVKAIAGIVRDHAVAEIVVGLPVSMSGQEGESARHARAFAETLESYLSLPIHLQDERLTTVEAERALRDRGLRGRARRDVVDQAAATLILQAWLDAARSR